ncbi:hypothetical protein BpHYR1_054411 [Brachionus plicatilis]|uniref:Uncharacterized protein n=1 Tax=Brachionus plicatilis TaxID=10195 RepID=A0A3M7QCF4_BRAPC|nr:hypothetical protein BpHYR1_054411 [Brachionus plicatilis]
MFGVFYCLLIKKFHGKFLIFFKSIYFILSFGLKKTLIILYQQLKFMLFSYLYKKIFHPTFFILFKIRINTPFLRIRMLEVQILLIVVMRPSCLYCITKCNA